MKTETVHINFLIEAKNNPRGKNDKSIDDLANSIREQGILQPLIVRPSGEQFEIIAGHRRYKAAQLSGLIEIPVVVRNVSDDDAEIIRMIENVQREDVCPIEEAEYLSRLNKKQKVSVEDLSIRIGKSKQYIYSRMKLADLHNDIKKDIAVGNVPTSVGTAFARIQTKEDQQKMYKQLKAHRWDDDPITYSEALEHVRDEYLLVLKDVPFIDDPDLVKNIPACVDCKNRTKNFEGLFPDVDKEDRCTDVKCFEVKKKAYIKKKIKTAKELGQIVLEGKDAESAISRNSKYVDIQQRCYDDPKDRYYRDLLKRQSPNIVLACDQSGEIHELVESKEAVELIKASGFKFYDKKAPKTSVSDRENKKKEKEKEKITQYVMDSLLGHIADVAEKEEVNEGFWKLLCKLCLDRTWSDGLIYIFQRRGLIKKRKEFEQIDAVKFIDSLTDQQAKGFLIEMFVCTYGSPVKTGRDDSVDDVCKYFDIERKREENCFKNEYKTKNKKK